MEPQQVIRKDSISLKSFLLKVFVLAVGCGLGWALFSLPSKSTGLSKHVLKELGHSGVNNQVTAVLLNFRGYDTLLELGVLLLAVLGVCSLGARVILSALSPPSLILRGSIRLLIPLMVVVAGYLLWAGKDAPGGAFQAGAVLGAAGVLLLLLGIPHGWSPPEWPLRTALVLGLLSFLAVAAGVVAFGGRMLEYPRGWAGNLILMVESAATVSIAATLAVLFAGGKPEKTEDEHGKYRPGPISGGEKER